MKGKQYNLDHIQLRLNLLEQVKSKVQLIEGVSEQSVKNYFKPYKKDLHEKLWFPVQRSEFIKDLMQSDVVLAGDFHAFAQAQRTHLRIIRSLKKLNRPLVLALECFESKDQKIVDLYLAGELSEEELKFQTDWEKAWGFPYKNYLPILRFAKMAQCKIKAINVKSTVEGDDFSCRDAHIAQQIMQARRDNKGCFVYVVIGDLHIATPHLPASLESIDPGVKLFSVFQNSEKLYFDLLRKGIENKVDILKSKDRQYCILTSPPWVKWQSYLMYLESTDDDNEIEYYAAQLGSTDEDYYEEDDEEDFSESVDLTDQLFSIFTFLCVDLGLEISFDQAEVFTDVTDFLLTRFESELSTAQFELIKKMVQNSRSFYLPELGVLYLSRFTTNHASEVLGHYMQAQLSSRRSYPFQQPDHFKPLIWVETVAYFMSKIYNHKRKTMGFKALKAELLTINPKDSNHEVLKHSLGQTMNEYFSAFNLKRSSLKLDGLQDTYSYTESARILGQFKGEQLFQKYKQGLLSEQNIQKLIAKDVFADDFAAFYDSIIKVLLSKKRVADKKEYIL